MNSQHPENPLRRLGRILISLASALSISGSYLLAGGPVFLPLIVHKDPAATPTPVPPETQKMVVNPDNVDRDWALAYFAKSYNGAGRPVMQIYPGDSSPESERIKIARGEIVLVLKDNVKADGGGLFWQLAELKGRKGETLFLRAVDVTKVVG